MESKISSWNTGKERLDEKMKSKIMPGKNVRTGNAVWFKSLKVIAGIVLMIVMTATT